MINKNPRVETKPKVSILNLKRMRDVWFPGQTDTWMTFPAGEIHLQIHVYLRPMNLKQRQELPYMACVVF